jgi:hypothetical protein
MEGRAWRGKAGRGKGGRGRGPPNPGNKGDYYESFENSGYSRKEGDSASYHVSNSGSRTEAPRKGTQQALEWLARKESSGANHNWGREAWNYPKGWPDRYWKDGVPCCPPQVEGRAEEFFQGALGQVFAYSGLEFSFIGSHPRYRAKPHWQPHPLPKRARTRGLRLGKGSRRQPRSEEGPEEEDQGDLVEPTDRKACEWFAEPTI